MMEKSFLKLIPTKKIWWFDFPLESSSCQTFSWLLDVSGWFWEESKLWLIRWKKTLTSWWFQRFLRKSPGTLGTIQFDEHIFLKNGFVSPPTLKKQQHWSHSHTISKNSERRQSDLTKSTRSCSSFDMFSTRAGRSKPKMKRSNLAAKIPGAPETNSRFCTPEKRPKGPKRRNVYLPSIQFFSGKLLVTFRECRWCWIKLGENHKTPMPVFVGPEIARPYYWDKENPTIVS